MNKPLQFTRPVLLIAVLCLSSLADSKKVVSFDEERHYSQTLGSPFGNVFHFKLGAGDKTALRRHDHDFLIIPLGNWEMEDLTDSGTTRIAGGIRQQVFYMRGGFTHRLENISDSTAKAVVIELKDSPGANSAVRIEDGAPGEFLLVFERLLVYKLRIEPHGEVHQRRERQSFFFALSDCQIDDTRIHLRPGHGSWSPNGHLDFYNPGKKPAEIVVVEERWEP